MGHAVVGRRLPRRDLVLLPLLVLLTLLIVGGGVELASRLIYPSAEADSCLVRDAKGEHRHYKPNCTSWTKLPEGPWVLNRYNACGYRTLEACGPKPVGALRVGVLGSSTAGGYMVPYDLSVAARSSKALTAACRRPVEFQNLGGEAYDYNGAVQRVDEALSKQADALVMVLTSFDIENVSADAAIDPPAKPTSLIERVSQLQSDSRALYILQYFLLDRDESYLPFWVKVGKDHGFMRQPLPPEWTARLTKLDSLLAVMSAKSHAAGVPLVLVYAPPRPAAAMSASGGTWPGFDAYALSEALGQIASRHGVIYTDFTRAIPGGTESSSIYYPVNKHLNGEGHGLLSRTLVERLKPLPPFQGCTAGGA